MANKPIHATIDATKRGDPIQKYIYGQFIEHLGDLINHGLWAELLDDRKFWFSIDNEPLPEPRHPHMPQQRRWRPVGPEDAVVMDRDNAYVGAHSPHVALDDQERRGIRQSGIPLRKDRSYTGRIVLCGETASVIDIILGWGTGAQERQTIRATVGSEYATIPVTFSVAEDTEDGWFEISALGSGAFHVGAASLMPSDNLGGFRSDTIALLKQLNSGIYRFPGGNFVSNHDWKDAVGDPDKRPPRWDHAWHVLQPNDVGTDEFMVLCGLLDVEPYITVNAGYGEARAAAEWVEYANGSADTPMGAWRAANGHPEPYAITWWGIGNEMYGWWQHGYMSLPHFVIKHKMFAEAMLAVDPTIKLIASGAMPDEMTVTTNARRVTGKVLAEYGTESDWSGTLLAECLDTIDVLSEHYYVHHEQRFDMDEAAAFDLATSHGGFVPVEETLVEWARRPANRIRCKAEHYAEYLDRIPGLAEKRVPVNIDEWAYARLRPDLKMALSYGWAMHEMYRHSDCITMAAYTFATACIDWNLTDAVMNTAGMFFKLYRDHFGRVPLAVAGDSPQPPPQYPVGGDQPQVNAGSDTYPLDVAAALTQDGSALTVAVVNPTEDVQALDLRIDGVALSGTGQKWLMTGPAHDAKNEVGQPAEVTTKTAELSSAPSELSIAPISITIYRLDLAD